MKLFHYDHCPYCVKARMIFGLKNQAFEEEILLNDDEKTPISMIGVKMLPILKKDSGDFMPESMDIVHYIDSLNGEAIVKPTKNDPQLNQWLQEVRNYHYALAMPRWVQMDLEEFQTQSAIDYFTRKKESSIGPFAESIKKSTTLIEEANDHLKKLDELYSGGLYFWGDDLTEDDFHVFATLRILTTTQGVIFPDRLNTYMESLSHKTNIPLHWDKAIGA